MILVFAVVAAFPYVAQLLNRPKLRFSAFPSRRFDSRGDEQLDFELRVYNFGHEPLTDAQIRVKFQLPRAESQGSKISQDSTLSDVYLDYVWAGKEGAADRITIFPEKEYPYARTNLLSLQRVDGLISVRMNFGHFKFIDWVASMDTEFDFTNNFLERYNPEHDFRARAMVSIFGKDARGALRTYEKDLEFEVEGFGGKNWTFAEGEITVSPEGEL